jgi:topoisomerase-4 subunit A
VIPELTMRFDDDIIVLEKWIPNKPISVIYWEGDKELFYLKRFLVENPDKEEKIITEHPKSYLEKVFTDYRPIAEIVFSKKRGMDRKDNQEINIEEFISIKGSSAMGNQLTREKVLEINALAPLPYEVPEVPETLDIEVVDEENIVPETKDLNKNSKKENNQIKPKGKSSEGDEEGQITLF